MLNLTGSVKPGLRRKQGNNGTKITAKIIRTEIIAKIDTDEDGKIEYQRCNDSDYKMLRSNHWSSISHQIAVIETADLSLAPFFG